MHNHTSGYAQFVIYIISVNGPCFDDKNYDLFIAYLVKVFEDRPQTMAMGVKNKDESVRPNLKWMCGLSQTIRTGKNNLHIVSLVPKMETEFAAAQHRFLSLNKTETRTDAYILQNCGITADLSFSAKQTLQLQLQVNNVTDKSYQSNLSRLKYFEYYNASPNGHLGIYNMGRNFYVKMNVPF